MCFSNSPRPGLQLGDRASRSVGAAVGEAIRLDAFRAHPFEVDPFEEAAAEDPWAEDRAGDADPTAVPREFVPDPQPQPRGWWGRFASITGSRFTRASMAAGIVAGLVTLLPPGWAAVLGAPAAALIA